MRPDERRRLIDAIVVEAAKAIDRKR